MSALGPLSVAVEKQKRSPRITPAAVALLKKYYNDVSHYIDSDTAREVSKQVRALPGNEHYDHKKVQRYMERLRATDAKKNPRASGAGETQSPNVAPESRAQSPDPEASAPTDERLINLTALIDSTRSADISEPLLRTWANILKLPLPFVQSYVQEHQDAARNARMRTITHLPTPSHSISPEPQQPRPSLKVETALSPTITFASLATGIGIAGPSSPRKSVEAVPPTPISANLDYGDMFMTRLSSLFSQDGAQGEDAMDIDNDEEQEANDRAAPTSPGTFDARFAEFEQRMEGFLRSVEEGELEEFGWSSDLVPLDSS